MSELIERLCVVANITRTSRREGQLQRDLVEILATCYKTAAALERSGDLEHAELIRLAVHGLFFDCGSGRFDPPPSAALAMPVPRPYETTGVHGSFIESASA